MHFFTPNTNSKRIYSAVLDPKGEFVLQAQRLVWSLIHLANVAPSQIVLHVAGSADAPTEVAINSMGVRVIFIPPYSGHPWCNKLKQLSSLDRFDFDDVVLLDCDIVVLQEPTGTRGVIMAKPVDYDNPPIEILSEIFSLAELQLTKAAASLNGKLTSRANANGGVYIIPRAHFKEIADEWQRWAEWCMARKVLFGEYAMHIDQVSFALAIASSGLPFEELELCWNFPTHVEVPPELDCTPKLIHYHRAVDNHQNLRTVQGLPVLNDAICEINNRWSEYFYKKFDNSSFWNSRYKLQPSIGSGVGSRGEVLLRKQHLLKKLAEITNPQSVIDIGGGDGQTASVLRGTTRILAYDCSRESRSHYLAAIPDAQWEVHDICASDLQAEGDLAMCLDMLIHLPSLDQYQAAIDHLCALRCDLLISGFDASPPINNNFNLYYYEPLSVSLGARGRVWIPLGHYRDLCVFYSPRPNAQLHHRDIRDSTLQAAVPFISDTLLFIEALYKSRQFLGFFPNHLPRCIEYPWIVSQLPQNRILRVLDAGAGVSILPIMLAGRLHTVFTVDPSVLMRSHSQKNEWNEWGFLDYSTITPSISSFNIPFEHVMEPQELDVVCSVSVIEHLPRNIRLTWFRKAASLLKHSGLLLLTVDTVPFSKNLWNYSEGKQVEDEAIHGNVDSMIEEMASCGFAVETLEFANWLPESRVGMARIKAKLTELPN